jgi:hypothetical protein
MNQTCVEFFRAHFIPPHSKQIWKCA